MNEAFLLDTHTWLWLAGEQTDRIGSTARRRIEDAVPMHRLGVSEISLWEVAWKAGRGKLRMPDPRGWLARACKMPGIGIVQVDREVLVESALLEWTHRDPADRLLVATARRHGMRIATADDALLDYCQGAGKVSVLDVRI